MRQIMILVAAAATATALAVAISPSRADDDTPPAAHDHAMGSASAVSPTLAKAVANARIALAPYATDLDAAKTAGYSRQITPMMKNMGYHYMDPNVTGFDVRRPPILVYVRRGDTTQLVAAEWVFASKPAKPPLPGARYGSFPAACHFDDGTFTPQKNEKKCAPKSPDSGAGFTFWHPDLVTLHLWLWYPNPDGVFNSTNALVAPFNRG